MATLSDNHPNSHDAKVATIYLPKMSKPVFVFILLALIVLGYVAFSGWPLWV